jgi:hypothetical protein
MTEASSLSSSCSGGYKKRETLPVDAEATDAFIQMVKSIQDGGGVSFLFDTNGEGDDGASMTMLEMRVNEEEVLETRVNEEEEEEEEKEKKEEKEEEKERE